MASRKLDLLRYRVRLLYIWLADTLALRRQPARPASHNVLVLRLDHLGDFILWLPAARAVRDRFPRPHYRIVLLANQQWASWVRQLGIFDAVWAADRTKLARSRGYRTAWLRRLRRNGFGVVCNPLLSREFALGDLLVRATAAPQSIGLRAARPSSDEPLLSAGERWYSSLIPAPEAPIHELHLNATFARALGTELVLPTTSWLLAPAEGCAGMLPAAPYVVVAPGTSDPRKNWPASRFIQVLRRLRSVGDWSIVLCGGRDQDALGRQIVDEFGAKALNLAGQTTLAQLSAVIAGGSLVLSSDSGPAHLAVALGVPSVAIVGGGHPGRFLPYPEPVARPARARHASTYLPCYGCNWVCKFEVDPGDSFPCIEQVTVDQVWQQVVALVQETCGAQLADALADGPA